MENFHIDITANVKDVKRRINDAAGRAGVSPESITLVVASKAHGRDMIEEAFQAGITDFGENYLQEALDKREGMEITPRWHFIGHLQKNKVRLALENFSLIQSLDSLALLKRIDRIAKEGNIEIDILLQVNLVGEETKYGFSPREIEPALKEADGFKNARIKGLMIIPPFYDEPEKNRENFRRLKEISESLDKKGFSNWESKYLSMGMTDDFEIAIEEGSNMVRVGRAIFGPRRR